jgi:N-acetyl-alpha-D-glucosaminyl L-malate synthase BshA
MNIVILNYHRIGGSGIVAYEIGRAMAEDRGHRVHFMGLEPPFRLKHNFSEALKFHKVWVKEYPVFDYQPYDLALASQLSAIIDRCNIDVIHSHYALPHAVSALLAREIAARDVRCVTTLHGTDITVVGAHPSMMNITRYAIERCDAVTAVSDHLRRESEKKLGITPGKIETVYNFINPQTFNPSLRPAESPGMKEKVVILHSSNLRPVKSPLDVIRIFQGIAGGLDRPAELWIVGEGPLQEEMMRLAEELGIADMVHFLGVYGEMGALIASSHLMLLPSKQESFGLAALEAMACGVPVVASRVGGLPEVIDDGKTGLLYTYGRIEEAVEKALRVLTDPGRYAAMRQAAIDSVEANFPMEKILDRYEAIYRGEPPGGSPSNR